MILLVFNVFKSSAQEQKVAPPFSERLFFGGSFALQLGTFTDIEVSPFAGYWILPRIAIALGPDYRYYSYNKNNTHIYGAKTYIELTVLRNINSVIPIGTNTDIIGHFENQLLSLESSYFDPSIDTRRFYVNTLLAGPGLSQQIGRRSSLNILVLWALNAEKDYGIYSNPEIRLTFVF
jgi:hypothetical protein